jgi:hypothetical protein
VRWWAHTHFRDDYQAAASDPRFQELWQLRSVKDHDTRMKALEDMGVLELDEDGRWKYSNAYMTWLFEEM